ncbi:small nuclear ribonucleoprotein Sm D-like protein [Cloeon dipterum]|uniref:small nuclear ribonucleoprotein Sm D-like protein n=1 Tax=Cloeon dipterum TaxID=197152 RepID=UPI00321FB264
MKTREGSKKKDKEQPGSSSVPVIPSHLFTPRKAFSQEVASSPLISDQDMDVLRDECGDMLHTAEDIIDAGCLSPPKTPGILRSLLETPNTKKNRELSQMLLKDLELSESEIDTPCKSTTPIAKMLGVPSSSKVEEASTSGLEKQRPTSSQIRRESKIPSSSSSEETSESSGDDLDIYSSKFDAKKALSLGKAFLKRLPYPNTKKLNNLAQYKHVASASPDPEDFEENMKNALKKKPLSKKSKDYVPPPKADVPITRKFLPSQMPISRPSKESKKKKNLLDRMELAKGPLAKLVEYRDKKIRVMIKTRNIYIGTNDMVAYIVAFDKHWNLALTDVEETFIRKKKRKVPAELGEDTVKLSDKELAERGLVRPRLIQNIGKNSELCKRYIPQLMIRGEQIVIVFPVV